METLIEKKLKERFVSDYKLPIQLIQNPYFEKRLRDFEDRFGSESKFILLNELIKKKFDNNPGKFLEEYSNVRNNIIESTLNSDSFKRFNELDLSKFKIDKPINNANLYTETQANEDNNFFISFDLKKANFQAFKFIDPKIILDTNTYEEFIGKFTDLDYVKDSKYTRQVIFGKLNPKRTMTVEKYLINKVHMLLSKYFPIFETPFSMNSDEVIYKLSEKEFNEFDYESIHHLPVFLKDELGLDVRVNKFKLHLHQFIRHLSESVIDVYEKEQYDTGVKNSFYCVPITYAPQIYKLLDNKKIDTDDLAFYYEHEIAYFKYPLTLNQEIENKIKRSDVGEWLPF